MIKSTEWFRIDTDNKTFESIKDPSSTKWSEFTKLDAWQKTLEKWALICRGYNVAGGSQANTCGLCNLYRDLTVAGRNCTICPVAGAVSAQDCRNTPFVNWLDYRNNENSWAEFNFLLSVFGNVHTREDYRTVINKLNATMDILFMSEYTATVMDWAKSNNTCYESSPTTGIMTTGIIHATKWFEIDEAKKIFRSERTAYAVVEAWDKTLSKWSLICDGYKAFDQASTCGLCNLYNIEGPTRCKGCPIFTFTHFKLCAGTPLALYSRAPSIEIAREEYKFLEELHKNYPEFEHRRMLDEAPLCLRYSEDATITYVEAKKLEALSEELKIAKTGVEKLSKELCASRKRVNELEEILKRDPKCCYAICLAEKLQVEKENVSLRKNLDALREAIKKELP